MEAATTAPLLSVENLSISFARYGRGLHRRALPVIADLSVSVRAQELVAVVGSSGSGKSLLAHAILGILPYNAAVRGSMRYGGEPLTPRRQRALRGRELVLVPQSVSYLDPLMPIGSQVRNGRRTEEAFRRADEVLARYGLQKEIQRQYPFELSGGMARRVLISTAVVQSPRLIIADEPTPGLHLSIAKRVLGHFRELADAGAGVLLITHDLELALEVADRVVVLYAGTAVEEAAAGDFEREECLRHPYTRALWRAMPRHGFGAVAGVPPYAGEGGPGCAFAPRCPHRAQRCEEPVPYRRADGGWVRCVLGKGELR